MAKALRDENGLVRRVAVRLLIRAGAPAREPLVEALSSLDLVVRCAALRGVCDLMGVDATPHLARSVRDEHDLVRLAAVAELMAIEPRTVEISELLTMASKDEATSVRQLASKALWTFHKETVSIRDRADWDHDVKVSQTIPLPKEGWRFRLDRGRDGHLKMWFKPGLDDSKWGTIAIEQAWQKAGYDYVGVSWYRRWLDLPAKPKHIAVEIRFDGVDECAWVWLNGQYVGQHDIGPDGYDKPFVLDITKELKWGDKNHITVRAMNTVGHGGIWKPVQIEVLE